MYPLRVSEFRDSSQIEGIPPPPQGCNIITFFFFSLEYQLPPWECSHQSKSIALGGYGDGH